MISGHSSISSNFFSFLTRNVLFHPLPGGVRYQDKWAPVMDINETFISRGRDNQKPFRLITTLKRSASDRGHEDWLAIFTVDEIGVLRRNRRNFRQPINMALSRARSMRSCIACITSSWVYDLALASVACRRASSTSRVIRS